MDIKLQPFIFNHPLIDVYLTRLRDKKTGSAEFRQAAKLISILMGIEILDNLKVIPHSINTPLSKFTGKKLDQPSPTFVSILRAGNVMVESLLELYPEASVGHIGLYRDHESLEPKEYFNSLDNNISNKQVFVCDPMLATGGSAIYAINLLKSVGAKDIRFACILAAEKGIQNLMKHHPDVQFFVAAKDEKPMKMVILCQD